MTFGFPALLVAALLGRNELLVCAVAAVAEKRQLDPMTYVCLVEVESEYNPNAKSKTGDEGLPQINTRIHGKIISIIDSISKGADIFGAAVARGNGDVLRGLSIYNTGRVSRRGIAYAHRILTLKARLDKAIGRIPWQHRSSWRLSRSGRSYCWPGIATVPALWSERRRWRRYSGRRSRWQKQSFVIVMFWQLVILRWMKVME